MDAVFCVWRESLKAGVWFIAAVFLGGVLLGAGALLGGEALPAASALPSADAKNLQPLESRQLAERIDEYFVRYWQASSVVPAPRADDAEFLRRAYLDLVGKIPTVAEVRAFVGDTNATKRAELVDALLKRGACATHFANTWRGILLAGAADSPETRFLVPRLETWLKLRFAANAPYDQIARELLTATLNDNPQRAILSMDGAPDPLAFYQAAERKPEQLAASTSRVFLGVQVQCAQCHDHPRAHWTRQNFWSYAAFFADLDRSTDDSRSASGVISIKIPETETTVAAMYLDGSTPKFQPAESRRRALVRWLTADENRWFAEAAVNRVWEQLLGRGLVDPVDDLEADSAAEHAQLRQLLAQQFRLQRYDLQYLVRAITASRVYQLSSRSHTDKAPDRRHFACMPLRRMTGEQLFDSLVQATGTREAPVARGRAAVFSDAESMRAAFQQKFSDTSVARTEAETTILQALSLMNGKIVTDATDLKTSETLGAVANAPFLDTRAKVETLFLATLSRHPTIGESAQFVAYVEKGGPSKNADGALADVFWALLNCAEFSLVH